MKVHLTTLLLVLIQVLANAQTIQVSGKITDATTKEVITGAAVVGGKGQGVISDDNGNFKLTAEKGELLKISFIGYTSVTLPAQASMNIALEEYITPIGDLIIVATRTTGRTTLTTPVPVDVIQLSKVQKAMPQNDLNQILTYLAPSFQSNRQSASDGTEHIDPASLRGLGPDQTLVLINGKRRHTSSLLNNQGTFGNGSVGTDLNAIPISAIDRVEVLRDGASAQYGSDAIAGVINIILKRNIGLNVSATGGMTKQNDGKLGRVSANYGFNLGKKGGFLNLSADVYQRGRTNRTQNHDLVIFDQSAIGNFFAYPFCDDPAAARAYDDSIIVANGLTRDDFNFQVGDAKINNISLGFNMSLPVGAKGEFYSFGTYNVRKGEGYGFRRLPTDTYKMVFSKFPYGFQPTTGSNISDQSVALGYRQGIGNWNMDLSNTSGENRFKYSVNNTVNASLKDQTPTSFDAGLHSFFQNTTNLDFSRRFDFLKGYSLGLGAEARFEKYNIEAGEEASWKNYGLVTNADGTITDTLGLAGGAQSFPGFTPDNAISKGRNNLSLYVDNELDITKEWLVALAGRFERYSDFGNTFNYKVATRYLLGNFGSVRAAYSTGFRAPSLHQQYFSYVSTTILSDGRLGNSGFFRNDSQVAKALGIPTLEQETSRNISAGITLKPLKNLSLSVDAYQIEVDNRIVLTGFFGYDPFGGSVPEIQSLFLPYEADGGRFFTNAINTKTQGVDVVASYNLSVQKNKFDITVLANFNKTTVGDKLNIPTILAGQEDIYFSPAERGLIERVNPRQKYNVLLGYTWNEKLSVLLANTYFGESYRNGFPFGVEQTFAGKWVTDLSLGYEFAKGLSLTVGANNLLDAYPDAQAYENSYFGVFKYAPVQMGMNGANYFARINYTLQK